MHDEMVILSYPGPDRSVNLEKLRIGKAQSRRYRNRRIGEFLKEFEFDDDYSYFWVRLPAHKASIEAVEVESDLSPSRAPSEQILNLIQLTPLSMTEQVKALKLKSKTGSLKRTVKILLLQGFVEYTIPEKPFSRLQKYKLTQKGKDYITNREKPS